MHTTKGSCHMIGTPSTTCSGHNQETGHHCVLVHHFEFQPVLAGRVAPLEPAVSVVGCSRSCKNPKTTAKGFKIPRFVHPPHAERG